MEARAGRAQIHRAAIGTGDVAAEHQLRQGGIAEITVRHQIRAVEPAATGVRPDSIGLPGGNHETIDHRAGAVGLHRGIQPQHVIAVAADDVGPSFGDGVAIGIGVVGVDIARQDAEVQLRIARAALALVAGKTAVELHVRLGRKAVRCDRAGRVHARRHPHLGAGRVGQCRLQAGVGIVPRRPGVAAAGIVVDKAGGGQQGLAEQHAGQSQPPRRNQMPPRRTPALDTRLASDGDFPVLLIHDAPLCAGWMRAVSVWPPARYLIYVKQITKKRHALSV